MWLSPDGLRVSGWAMLPPEWRAGNTDGLTFK